MNEEMERGKEILKMPFRRDPHNPILTPLAWPYPANAVFNPGAVLFQEETVLLVRVEDMRGFSHLTIAKSKDGRTNWRISSHPTLCPDLTRREERYGLEDPRVVWLEKEGRYAITYVCFSSGGPSVSLALTGAIVEKDISRVRLYYGAADTVIALASANLDELLSFLRKH